MPVIETKGAASAQGFGEFAKTGVANYIEDVFSTYLYTGTASTQTITNGIDLSTKGGLVWVKSRSVSGNNWTQDTARGVNSVLYPNLTNAAGNPGGTAVSSFDTTGFTLGTNTNINNTGDTYASWTFRKQAKFFDVVTYTGDGANRTIAHSLGSVPGCIIVKRTDTAGAWAVYHRSLANTEYLVLNTNAAKATGTTYWNSTTPTATEFALGTNTAVNANGGTYVAYLFAHDAGGFGLSGTDNVISCGSYVGTGGTEQTISLGYEPQWVLIKAAGPNGGSGWVMADIMRGIYSPNTGSYSRLYANVSDAESDINWVSINSTGFGVNVGNNFETNSFGETFIYIAIRRGPMKTPTTGTSVFTPLAYTGTGAARSITSIGSPTDFLMSSSRSGYSNLGWGLWDRLRGTNGSGNRTLVMPSTGAEQTGGQADISSFDQLGVSYGNSVGWGFANALDVNYIEYFFRRAPNFFDEVCYSGTGANRTVTHNLGVVPELMIIKRRGADGAYQVYSAALSNTEYLSLSTNAAKATGTTRWNSTTPTASVFSLGTDATVNASGSTGTYVAYLFATCAGVSKVGSYTGTGTTLQVDCGFTGGARFVLIKRTDSTGDWYVWDSARGIVAGNDPYLLLNSAAAEVTTTDWVDTHNPGFELSNAAGNLVNISTATYIFLAIA